MDFEKAYHNIRQSDLNNLVGGSDPEFVGNACREIIDRHYEIKEEHNILDFGCGAGRVFLSVLKKNKINNLVGVDIMPDAIRFCQENIGLNSKNTDFYLLDDKNDHYQRHIQERQPSFENNFHTKYDQFFDFTYAFSVFTHIAHTDFVRTLKSISSVTKNGGKGLITAFILTPLSRANIESKLTTFKFDRPKMSSDNKVFLGDTRDPLAFIAYDINEIESMFWAAGFAIEQIEFGAWRGVPAHSLQDVIVCRKI